MAKEKDKKKAGAGTPRIQNRKARHDYHIEQVVECGIELLGTEVKSIRAGQCKIDEGYARIRGGEVMLLGVNIAHYQQAGPSMQHEPLRERKLLLRRRQIDELLAHVTEKGNTLVPLAMYFSRGWAKVELGLATGKQQFDKRQDLKKKDAQRDIAREMSRRRRS